MIVNDVICSKHHMQRAQGGMDDSVEMLGANCRNANHTHAIVALECRGEVIAAIDGNVISICAQLFAYLFVICFDSAVFGNHTTPADESNFQPRSGELWPQRGGLFCRTHVLVEPQEFA